MNSDLAVIEAAIKIHKDFPKAGIMFRDVLPITLDPIICRKCISLFATYISNLNMNVKAIVGLEARGFIFGPLIANELNISFIPIRKKGKLPGETVSLSYQLEYGQDTIELSKDALVKDDVVVIFDDLLATGGTMSAAEQLIENVGAKIAACCVIIELVDLNGKSKLKNKLYSLFQFHENQ